MTADDLDEAVVAGDGPVYFNCDLADAALVARCEQLGMVAELVTTSYRVPFAGALDRLPPRLTVNGYRIVPADQVATDRLYQLDIALRQHVPGTDGWEGNRAWFDAEMASAEFDASGYLVAEHLATGELSGLIRFWRNGDGPALGLLAVLPRHRGGYLSSVLFRHGLVGASGWGYDYFRTNTARRALQRRLERSGATVTGRFAMMVG